MGKQITETKCTCQACGNVWYYGKGEPLKNVGSQMQNCGKTTMCCTGCLPALAIPTKKTVDLNTCPKCNSKALTKETVVHDV